jgi:hypothetical protein
MVTLRVEEGIKRKTIQLQSCREFHGKCSGHKIAAYDEATSTEALQDDVDALDEAREVALARATQYQLLDVGR